MKYFQKIFFLFLFLSTLEAIEVSKNLMIDMSRTYGYYLVIPEKLDKVLYLGTL
jgi:hypothetical protein